MPGFDWTSDATYMDVLRASSKAQDAYNELRTAVQQAALLQHFYPGTSLEMFNDVALQPPLGFHPRIAAQAALYENFYPKMGFEVSNDAILNQTLGLRPRIAVEVSKQASRQPPPGFEFAAQCEVSNQVGFQPPPGLPLPTAKLATAATADLMVVSESRASAARRRRRQHYTSSEPVLQRTTIMLRNLANKYTIEELIEDLQNDTGCTAVRDYDLLYLPTDFKSKRNKSYGFINFTDEQKAKIFMQKVEASKQGKIEKIFSKHKSPKIMEACNAIQQGRDVNILNYFRLQCGSGAKNPWFRPVVLLSGENQQTLTLSNGSVIDLDHLWGNSYAVRGRMQEVEATPTSESASSAEAEPETDNWDDVYATSVHAYLNGNQMEVSAEVDTQ